MQIDVYHPLVASDHESTCAALCTNWNERKGDNTGCPDSHACWCPDGAMSYEQFTAEHPDVTVAEAEGL